MLISAKLLYAQDVIVTNDAQKIDAKIVEVSKTEIKYKEADNFDGPIFVLPTSDINSIIYSNGKVTLYNTSQKEELPMQRHNSATILLVNGDSILGEITDMNSGSITYSQNGKRFTLPASQVRTVTLANGQVRQYTQVSVSSTPTQKSTTETSSSRHEVVMFERSDDTGVYYLGDKSMTEKQYLEFISHNCDVAWDVYRKGKKMEKAGYILMLVGAPLTGIGLGCIIAGGIGGLADDIIIALLMERL